MPDLLLRLLVLLILCAGTGMLILGGRYFVERRRRQVLEAPALAHNIGAQESTASNQAGKDLSLLHILAFSSDDCRQCHQLQMPALRRLKERYGEDIAVIEVDAPTSPELTQRYKVLTLPTTVILDTYGKAHAINYGFANVQQLSRQIQEAMATVVPTGGTAK